MARNPIIAPSMRAFVMTLFRSKQWQRRVAASFVACWALSAWAQVCSTPGKDGVGALTGILWNRMATTSAAPDSVSSCFANCVGAMNSAGNAGAPPLMPDQQSLAIVDQGATWGGCFSVSGTSVARWSVASLQGARAEVPGLPSTGVVKVKHTTPSPLPVTNRQLMA